MLTKISLRSIRKVFHSWPSELDVARSGVRWAQMAQEFWCAAIVLNEESEKAHRSVGSVLNDQTLARFNCTRPAIWCLCFSLELAVKSALVSQNPKNYIRHKEKLPFFGHEPNELANKINGFSLSSDESDFLRVVSKVILNGKYPSTVSPSEVETEMLVPAFNTCFVIGKPIYDRATQITLDLQNQKP